jgi:hypothetical protein
MISAVEFNNLINGLPQLVELVKKFNLISISLIKALPSDDAQLFVGITHAGPMFALEKCAKINVQFSKLLGLDNFSNDVMVMDRQSFDTSKYDEYYKPNELVILHTDSEEIFTTSPEKINDFAIQVLKIDYSIINATECKPITQAKEISSNSDNDFIAELEKNKNIIAALKIHNAQVKARAEVPIILIKQEINQHSDDFDKMMKADSILKELQGLKNFFTDESDKEVVDHIMTKIKQYGTGDFQQRLSREGQIPSTKVDKIVILSSLYENVDYKDKFKFNEMEEKSEEIKSSVSPRPK